jgi:2'-5' RNA ligase
LFSNSDVVAPLPDAPAPAPRRGSGTVTAVISTAFDERTDEAIYRLRDKVRAAGVPLPDRPPHRPHFSLTAARVARDHLDAVVEVAAEIADRQAPIPLILSEVGRFGRAGALWLGPVPTRELAALQRDAYRSLKRAGWPPAFGDRSSPKLWIPHCTLATRVTKPLLRDLQARISTDYQPIRATVDGLAVILVGGRGDAAHLPFGRCE